MSIDKGGIYMQIKTTNYVCSVCNARNVKLWRPNNDDSPLICATCAEKRQSPREYGEMSWTKKADGSYKGIPTGKMLPLPKWTVNAKGKVPIYDGPGPEGLPQIMTDQLIVDLSDVSESYTSGETTMLPASPTEDGGFWGYTSVPEEVCEWWENLPTR